MPFHPQSQYWPGSRAVLLVHGVGDASDGDDGAFPQDALRAALGTDSKVAVYRISYDFINDWLAAKVDLQAGIAALKAAIRVKFGDDEADAKIAEYAGDVLWPILSLDLRYAVRDALIAQLNQIQIDRGESALRRGHDPLDYQVSIVAHSLGCFHTYEVLHAVARERSYRLRPAGDLVTFDSVMLFASPVQLIRSVVGTIQPFVPELHELATVSKPLEIPAEATQRGSVRCTHDFISVTGTHDPVGGHLLGRKLSWAYMEVPGQQSVIVPQQMLNIDSKDGTARAMWAAVAGGAPPVNNPHSWNSYISGQGKLLRGVILT